MKKVIRNYLIMAAIFITYCCTYIACDVVEPCTRIGAKCNDGTTTTATGSGACSSHGGVKDWLCE